jgi:hypothetical protein
MATPVRGSDYNATPSRIPTPTGTLRSRRSKVDPLQRKNQSHFFLFFIKNGPWANLVGFYWFVLVL